MRCGMKKDLGKINRGRKSGVRGFEEEGRGNGKTTQRQIEERRIEYRELIELNVKKGVGWLYYAVDEEASNCLSFSKKVRSHKKATIVVHILECDRAVSECYGNFPHNGHCKSRGPLPMGSEWRV